MGKGKRMRPIDADALVKNIESAIENGYGVTVGDVIATIEYAPTIDAVPVVRCKDCKHYREGIVLSPQKFCFRLKDRDGKEIGYTFAEDDFCSYGERSEDGET